MSSSAQGFRSTRQRELIHKELCNLKTHPSAETLLDIVRQKLPTVSLATVYRTLDVLWKRGLILRLDLAGTQLRWDGDVSPHFHMRCLHCDQIIDVAVSDVVGVNHPRVLGTDYEMVGWRMEFHGVCPACQAVALKKYLGTKQEPKMLS